MSPSLDNRSIASGDTSVGSRSARSQASTKWAGMYRTLDLQSHCGACFNPKNKETFVCF